MVLFANETAHGYDITVPGPDRKAWPIQEPDYEVVKQPKLSRIGDVVHSGKRVWRIRDIRSYSHTFVARCVNCGATETEAAHSPCKEPEVLWELT